MKSTYAELRQKIHNTRDMIDGELNRIMVTDDTEEIKHLARKLKSKYPCFVWIF